MIVGVYTEKGLMKSSPSVYEAEGAKTSGEIKNLSQAYDSLSDIVFKIYNKKQNQKVE